MVIMLFRDKLNEALYLVGLVEKSYKAVEKKEKGRKRKERKTEGFFQKGRFVVLPPFFFKFLGAKLSGEL